MDIEPLREKAALLVQETAARGLEFLYTDVDTALNFAAMALQSRDDPERKRRNTENARKGFDAVVSFSSRLDPALTSEEAMNGLNEKLAVLRSRLRLLGEPL